jgi:hypothetical protein
VALEGTLLTKISIVEPFEQHRRKAQVIQALVNIVADRGRMTARVANRLHRPSKEKFKPLLQREI